MKQVTKRKDHYIFKCIKNFFFQKSLLYMEYLSLRKSKIMEQIKKHTLVRKLFFSKTLLYDCIQVLNKHTFGHFVIRYKLNLQFTEPFVLICADEAL